MSYQGYSGKGLTKIFQGNEHQGYSRKGLAKIFQGKEHQPKKRNQNIKIIVLTSPQDFSVVISRILKEGTYLQRAITIRLFNLSLVPIPI